MIRKPNILQQVIHRLVMLGPVTAFFAPWLHRVDRAAWKLTKGRYTVAQLAGWNIVQLTTLGAKTGQPRTLPLLGLFDGKRIALVASSFGRSHNPAWYYNLKAHPACEVQSRQRTGSYAAREAEGEEYDRYWQLAVSHYGGYQKYRERAAPRHIPIMFLEPTESS
jgi:deazaflavin-dependent oxidoreductase (nitroreductase family)